MIKFKKVEQTVNVCDEITCDVCKKNYKYNVSDDVMEIQEFVHISNTGGFSSIFGDCVNVSLDMCQHCFKKILGDYVRLSGGAFEDFIGDSNEEIVIKNV